MGRKKHKILHILSFFSKNYQFRQKNDFFMDLLFYLLFRKYKCYTLAISDKFLRIYKMNAINQSYFNKSSQMIKHIRLICCIVVLITSAEYAFSQSRPENTAVLKLIQEGKHFFKENENISASHSFAKVLMIDPNNEEAQYYLKLLRNNSFGSHINLSHIKELRKTVSLYRKKASLLEKTLHENNTMAEKEKAVHLDEIQALHSQLDNLKTELSAKDGELYQTQSSLSTLKNNFSVLEKQLDTSKQQVDGLKTTLTVKEETLNKTQNSLVALKDNLSDLEKQFDVSQLQVDGLKTKLSEKEEVLIKTQDSLASLESNFSDLQKRFDLAKHHWEQEKLLFAQEVIMLNQELIAFQNQRYSLQNKIALLEDENQTLRKDIISTQHASKQQSALEKALLKNLKHEVLQKDFEISQLKNEFADISRHSDSILKLLASKNHELALLDTSAQSLQDRILDEHSKWADVQTTNKETIARLNHDLDVAEKTLLVFQQNKERNTKYIEYSLLKNQTELKNKHSELLKARYDLELAKQKINERTQTIQDLNSKVAKLENDFSQFRHSTDPDMTNAYANLSEEYNGTVNSLKRKDSLIADLKNELANARRQLASLEQDVNQSRNKEFFALTESLKDIQAKIEKQILPDDNNTL